MSTFYLSNKKTQCITPCVQWSDIKISCTFRLEGISIFGGTSINLHIRYIIVTSCRPDLRSNQETWPLVENGRTLEVRAQLSTSVICIESSFSDLTAPSWVLAKATALNSIQWKRRIRELSVLPRCRNCCLQAWHLSSVLSNQSTKQGVFYGYSQHQQIF